MGVRRIFRDRDVEDMTDLFELEDLKGMGWVRLYTKYMGTGRMTRRDRTIIMGSIQNGNCRSTSFDCGEKGKGFRTSKLPEEGKLWKGREGGLPGQRTN